MHRSLSAKLGSGSLAFETSGRKPAATSGPPHASRPPRPGPPRSPAASKEYVTPFYAATGGPRCWREDWPGHPGGERRSIGILIESLRFLARIDSFSLHRYYKCWPRAKFARASRTLVWPARCIPWGLTPGWLLLAASVSQDPPPRARLLHECCRSTRRSLWDSPTEFGLRPPS